MGRGKGSLFFLGGGMSWRQKGLRFQCTGCGKCCTGGPGYVWLNNEETEAIACFLQLSKEDFLKKFTRLVRGKISLLEDPKSFDCVFLKKNRCKVYNCRPKQCRTFPWWKSNLTSFQAWERAAKECEGVNHKDAPLLSFEEIEKQIES